MNAEGGDIRVRADEIARAAVGSTITVHGRVWTTAQARARVVRLEFTPGHQSGPGPSDAVAGEIAALQAALDDHDRRYREAMDRATRELEIQQWRAKLAQLGPSKREEARPAGARFQIVATTARYGNRVKRTYSTEQAFYRGLINIRSKGGSIIHAGEVGTA